jgi:hypothetical protein
VSAPALRLAFVAKRISTAEIASKVLFYIDSVSFYTAAPSKFFDAVSWKKFIAFSLIEFYTSFSPFALRRDSTSY